MATKERLETLRRTTGETDIEITWNLDGSGQSEIETGIPFFDHMLTLFARHGHFDLTVKAMGDIDVDYHHTVEDTGLLLGQVLRSILGDRKGITRYGFFLLPMDETLAQVAVDLGNRPYLVYNVEHSESGPLVRDFNIHMLKEFYQAFANEAGANLHIATQYGYEPHHLAEGCFKAFARALSAALAPDLRLGDRVMSTKGSLNV
ncbi:MAG: imidazoleglycerol-phosphate dehydratase HisB [Opitutales bacterium]|nr:imidazoleglycerol-phosphate dehydratase HisB [Opitutales bacterium]NRA27893.1 imidazoleglycerol-phosphate dehydratase HisB [Opitutales bacterium]